MPATPEIGAHIFATPTEIADGLLLGRGFCPSCLGRRMAATAANLVECVLPTVALRQWVLTVPFPWRKRLAYDGALLGAVTRICVSTVKSRP